MIQSERAAEAREKLRAVIGADDPQAHLDGILKALSHCRAWGEAVCRDNYDRDVTFLLTLAEWQAARIAELELLAGVGDEYLHAAKEHIQSQNAEIERLRSVVADLAAQAGGGDDLEQ